MTADSNFKSGAVRSAAIAHLSFTSIPMVGFLAVARTAGEGASKYGRYNYMLGMPVHDILEHVFGHMVNYVLGDRTEPHLAHAAWGLMAAIQSQVLNPELSEPHMLGPGATVTPAVRAFLAEQAPILAARRASGELADAGHWKVEDLPEIQTLLAARLNARAEVTPEEGRSKQTEDASAVLATYPVLSALIPPDSCEICPGDLECEMKGCAKAWD